MKLNQQNCDTLYKAVKDAGWGNISLAYDEAKRSLERYLDTVECTDVKLIDLPTIDPAPKRPIMLFVAVNSTSGPKVYKYTLSDPFCEKT